MNVKKTLPKIGRRTYMRCDSAEQMFATLLADFNSRTWIRCDYLPLKPRLSLIYFNPRTWIRCDMQLWLRGRSGRRFQSTHLDKVRLALGSSLGVDVYISIHAPG